MNKLGIWGIAIAAAFIIGVLSANPVVDAAGGWQPAVADLQSQINALSAGPELLVVTGTASGGTSTATCPPTHTLIGGGFATLAADDYTPSGQRTYTSVQDSSDTWRVSVVDDSGIQSTVQAQAFCIK